MFSLTNISIKLMLDSKNILKIAKKVIKEEQSSIFQLQSFLDHNFVSAVQEMYLCNGRVIVSGVGKSAHVANKFVSTLNSIGQPSIFLHASDALHGDIGVIQKSDLIIVISNSGNTEEVKNLINIVHLIGVKLISICGNPTSYLANKSEIFINSFVEKEAGPNNLAPTSSTTAQLVLSDALAICLIESKGFTKQDFAKLHPAGILGRRLHMKVVDLISNFCRPVVDLDDELSQVILEISKHRVGAATVLKRETIVGIITDGDLRRMLEKHGDIHNFFAKDIMNSNPKIVNSSCLLVDALKIMKKNNISQLLVIDNDNQYLGVVHMHDILKEGI